MCRPPLTAFGVSAMWPGGIRPIAWPIPRCRSGASRATGVTPQTTRPTGRPVNHAHNSLVGATERRFGAGFEPATPRFTAVCSAIELPLLVWAGIEPASPVGDRLPKSALVHRASSTDIASDTVHGTRDRKPRWVRRAPPVRHRLNHTLQWATDGNRTRTPSVTDRYSDRLSYSHHKSRPAPLAALLLASGFRPDDGLRTHRPNEDAGRPPSVNSPVLSPCHLLSRDTRVSRKSPIPTKKALKDRSFRASNTSQ